MLDIKLNNPHKKLIFLIFLHRLYKNKYNESIVLSSTRFGSVYLSNQAIQDCSAQFSLLQNVHIMEGVEEENHLSIYREKIRRPPYPLRGVPSGNDHTFAQRHSS